MTEFALVVAAWILGSLWLATIVGQSLLTVAYYRWGRQPPPAPQADAECPPVAVVLCVRGADRNLIRCLTALDRLAYADYEVHIALDHANDPSASILSEFALKSARPFIVHTMPPPVHSGGLKCDRLLQLLTKLPERLQHIALVDADVRPPPSWLRDLVVPLRDLSVGAVSGNRWYLPTGLDLLNSVRVMWNAAAVVQMECFGIPWGGSLAFRRRSIEQLQLERIWNRTFCEDTVLAARFAAVQQSVVQHPALVMVDSGDLSWKQYTNWHRRQLLAVRLHHRAWPLVVLHGINGGVATLMTLVLLATLLGCWQWMPASMLAGSYAFYAIASVALMQLVARRNHRWLGEIDDELVADRPAAESGRYGLPSLVNRRGFTAKYLLWSLIVIPITQLHHMLGVIHVSGLQRITWSQIDYRVNDGFVVRETYRPFRATTSEPT